MNAGALTKKALHARPVENSVPRVGTGESFSRAAARCAAGLEIATFEVDATPPIGSPLCDAAVPPVSEIVDPLSARGIVILGSGRPIVLCAVDWVGIANGGNDAWRDALLKRPARRPTVSACIRCTSTTRPAVISKRKNSSRNTASGHDVSREVHA